MIKTDYQIFYYRLFAKLINSRNYDWAHSFHQLI